MIRWGASIGFVKRELNNIQLFLFVATNMWGNRMFASNIARNQLVQESYLIHDANVTALNFDGEILQTQHVAWRDEKWRKEQK